MTWYVRIWSLNHSEVTVLSSTADCLSSPRARSPPPQRHRVVRLSRARRTTLEWLRAKSDSARAAEQASRSSQVCPCRAGGSHGPLDARTERVL